MIINYSGKNLQGIHFSGQNLQNADFSGADLRGTDFSNANLTGAHFSKSTPGLRTSSKIMLFIFALLVSLLSGYIAMLAGSRVQVLIQSTDWRLQVAGYITLLLSLIFTAVALWKGLDKAISKVLVTIIACVAVSGLVMYSSGIGTGMGAVYGALALLLMALMFVVGTISRATIGTMGSNILFLIVAVGGSVFGRSIGGGLGTIIMAVACAIISKRALKHKSDSLLCKIALTISTRFGTSFKNADLTNADFSDTVIQNTNFSNAKLTGVKWNNSKKLFTLEANNEQ